MMKRQDTVNKSGFRLITIIINVIKNSILLLSLLIVVLSIAGLGLPARAQTRQVLPFRAHLRRQRAGLPPAGMGMAQSGNTGRSIQGGMGIHLVGHWNGNTSVTWWNLSVSGNYAYLPDQGYHIYVIDMSDPAAPKEVCRYKTDKQVNGIDVAGHYAYLTVSSGALEVLDVSDPTNPKLISSYSNKDSTYYGDSYGDISVSGNDAYVGGGSYRDTLDVIDVSDPAHPHQVGSIGFGSSNFLTDYCVKNGYAYVTTATYAITGFGFQGVTLHIIDVSDPANPKQIGSYNVGPTFAGNSFISVSGNDAYITRDSALTILDVSNPAHSQVVDSYIPKFSGPNGYMDGVFAIGGSAYTIDADQNGMDGLQVLDVSDPAHPLTVGTYEDSGAAIVVYANGGYIYMTEQNSGLYILKAALSNEVTGTVENVTLNKGSLPASPLSGAGVSLYAGTTLAGQAQTGADGSFQFPNQTDSSYTLRVGDNAINELTNQATHLSWDYTVKPTYYSIRLPVGLYNQIYTGAYALDHLSISSDVLFGLLPPQPLLNSYDPTATGALLQEWSTGATGVSATDTNSVYTRRIRALARHLMVQGLYQGEFTNAATMSHSLSTITTQLITNFVLAKTLANKASEKVSTQMTDQQLAGAVKTIVGGIRDQVRSTYLDPVIDKVANALPAPYNKYVPLAVGKTLDFFQSDSKKDFLTDILKDQTQALASTASDEILLSYGYVPATQPGLDRSAKLAGAFDYSGTTAQAFHDLVDTTTSSVLEQSNAATKLVKTVADKATAFGSFTKTSSGISQAIAELAVPTAETGVGAEVAAGAETLAGILKGMSLVSYLTAAIAPGLRLAQIAVEANNGIDVAYHPDQQSIFRKIVPEQASSRYLRYTAQTLQTGRKDLSASVDQYNQLVQQILSLIQNQQKAQALGKFSELMQADQTLDLQLQISQAPVDAVADQLAPTDSTFLAHYLYLTQANVEGAAARAGLYARLLGYALNQSVTPQQLTASADSVSKHLSNLENQTNTVTNEVSTIPAPPYVIISRDSLSTITPKSSQPFTLSAVVTNLGTSAATNVTVSLQTDSVTTIGSQKQVTIPSLGVGVKKVISWTLIRTDTLAMGSYTIDLSSDNAKVLPTTGTYYVQNTGLAATGIQGSIQTRPTGYHLGQNYPNPFNPTTTIRYTLAGSEHVSLTVYNVLGQMVARLVDRNQAAGAYSIRFNAHDLPSGLYIYRLKAGNFTQTRKMMLIK